MLSLDYITWRKESSEAIELLETMALPALGVVTFVLLVTVD